MIFSFLVPYITRRGAFENCGSGLTEGDSFEGFQMVYCGTVYFDDETKFITIVESEKPTEELLFFDVRNAAEIECGLIESENVTYSGGKIRFIGMFDRMRGRESLTFVLPVNEYHRFLPLLRKEFAP